MVRVSAPTGDGSPQTIGEVLDLINNDPDNLDPNTAIVARLKATGNGIELVDATLAAAPAPRAAASAPYPKYNNPHTKFNGIHGCDGCCRDLHPTDEQIEYVVNHRKQGHGQTYGVV